MFGCLDEVKMSNWYEKLQKQGYIFGCVFACENVSGGLWGVFSTLGVKSVFLLRVEKCLKIAQLLALGLSDPMIVVVKRIMFDFKTSAQILPIEGDCMTLHHHRIDPARYSLSRSCQPIINQPLLLWVHQGKAPCIGTSSSGVNSPLPVSSNHRHWPQCMGSLARCEVIKVVLLRGGRRWLADC